MTRKTAFNVAIFLAILHIVLAGVYASITPYRTSGILLGQRDPNTGGPARSNDIGAPDERQHANYVMHLLDGKGFPVLDPKDPELLENYQSHQPPLFYLLEAGWTKLSGTDLASSESGFKARFLNCLIGGLTVIGTFFLGVWGFKRFDLAVLAAAFVALLPMNCALSGAISNDPLLFCLCAWTLAICALGVTEGWTIKRAALCGLLAGLAIVTKTTGVGLAPILLLAVFISVPRPNGKIVATAAGCLLIACAPWLARNQSLYGDPLATSAFKEAFQNSPKRAMFTELLKSTGDSSLSAEWTYWSEGVWGWTSKSFFGVFGYMDIFLNEKGGPDSFPNKFSRHDPQPNALYRALTALMALVFIGWLFSWRNKEWRETGRIQTLTAGFMVVVAGLFVVFNLTYFQGQARYLFPAISCIGIGVAIAILSVARQKWQVGLGVLVAILVALNAYALTRLPEEFRKRTSVVSQLEPGTIQTDLLPVSRSNSRHNAGV